MIRKIKQEDFTTVYDMIVHFSTEASLLFDIDPQPENIKQLVDYAINSDNVVCYVAEEDNKVVGVIYSVIQPHILNSSLLYAEELIWWVRPEYRKNIGSSLLDKAEEELKERGITIHVMKYFLQDTLRPAILKRIFRNRGYTEEEVAVVKRL